jgi:aromatic ring-cleaving dioxygenase
MTRINELLKVLFVVLLNLSSFSRHWVQSLAFLPKSTSRCSHLFLGSSSRRHTPPENAWNKEHLIHGAQEIHEDTDDEVLDAEQAAAWDAHDCTDPGMEAAAGLRAVMMAQEMAHRKRHEQALHPATQPILQTKANDDGTKVVEWNDEEHLIHGAIHIHEETDQEVLDSERDAVWDAHDCSDPGMEAAAEERAVMLANEMAHRLREQALEKKEKSQSAP